MSKSPCQATGIDKPKRSSQSARLPSPGMEKIKPALIITNDFDISLEKVVRKYCRRWIVEKSISEQIEFFQKSL